MDDTSITSQFVSWLPMIAILGLWYVFMRRSSGRQGSMIDVGRENTEAVKENTEVLKAVLAKLSNLEKS